MMSWTPTESPEQLEKKQAHTINTLCCLWGPNLGPISRNVVLRLGLLALDNRNGLTMNGSQCKRLVKTDRPTIYVCTCVYERKEGECSDSVRRCI